MTIEEFIEARIAEDEDIAAGAEQGPRRDWAEDYGREFLVVSRVEAGIPVCDVRSTAESQHIARHDPARELRSAAAWRRVMEFGAALISASQQIEFEDTVLLPIAAIWFGHPDYDRSWAADGGGSAI
ncbi:DUF6221 family protein [Nocardia sp. NBC_00511]|uniref:DUF6221 family protein n=1 Tax=Nocardia sp. NBC_00511 TaxID=2903591 RepID=UPI0030E1BE45